MSVESRSPRALFVAYLFPPVGGVGVLRVTKFVKYLPEFGWNSSVLTVSNPSVPLFDESLLNDIPEDTLIRKAHTLEPDYSHKVSTTPAAGSESRLSGWKSRVKTSVKWVAKAVLQPEAQILWYPAAVKAGVQLLREVPHDVIVATGPPFTNLLVGAALSRKTGVPLILDYRDEWVINSEYLENRLTGNMARWVQKQMQSRADRAASAIIATTPSSASAIHQLAQQAGSRATATHIYNGFDQDDFSKANTSLTRDDYGSGTDLFRISFAGTMWNLTSIEPFVKGVRRLCERSPHLAERLEIVLAGRRAAGQEELIDQLEELPVRTVRLGYLEHAEVTRLMMTSDSLLLLLSDLPHADRVISSKVFEYMAAKRPVFAVTPEGDQCDVLREHPGATICQPSDVDGIANALADRIEEHRVGAVPDGLTWDFSQFDRKTQAGQLARLMETVSGRQSHSERSIVQSSGVYRRADMELSQHDRSEVSK
ncbi:MAG: glycosyltransferase [Planctomycetaceae bacterium]|nr:glycosyltransferase [Planctomycetaceae bacterium]